MGRYNKCERINQIKIKVKRYLGNAKTIR